MTNSLQGAEAGVRRQVTIEKSLVTTGGVLFDDARGIDGAATTTARSGIVAYGNLIGSRIAGPGHVHLRPARHRSPAASSPAR